MSNHNAYRLKVCFLLFVVVIAVSTMFSMKPISQDIGYHIFADHQERLGVANANDVISNVGFVIAGFIGLRRIAHWPTSKTATLWRYFFFSTVLVGLGSAYYHMQPTNATMVWDRMPMTLGFAALTSIVCAERLGTRVGYNLFLFIASCGLFSVIYWWFTEQARVGDLRLYILVQYLPMLLIPFMLLLFSKTSSKNNHYWFLLSSYVAAKLFEMNDDVIFSLTQQVISGHTLKHLVVAVGIFNLRTAILGDAETGSLKMPNIS